MNKCVKCRDEANEDEDYCPSCREDFKRERKHAENIADQVMEVYAGWDRDAVIEEIFSKASTQGCLVGNLEYETGKKTASGQVEVFTSSL